MMVLLGVRNRIATLTMNRPEKRNALSGPLVEALLAAFSEVSRDPDVRVVILTGAGAVFSAGADLAALRAMQDASFEENRADSRRLADLFEAIRACPKPVVARVNGHAIAGGCGLAAVCDHVVAAEGSRLGFTEVRIGFVPAIVSVFLRRRLTDGAMRDLLFTGRLVETDVALRMGLIDRVAAPDALDRAVLDFAETVVRETSGDAVAATKALLDDLDGLGPREAVSRAVVANAEARGTDDCRAGIAAFLDRVDPPWKRTD